MIHLLQALKEMTKNGSSIDFVRVSPIFNNATELILRNESFASRAVMYCYSTMGFNTVGCIAISTWFSSMVCNLGDTAMCYRAVYYENPFPGCVGPT